MIYGRECIVFTAASVPSRPTSDFISIEMVFPFGYLEPIVPWLAITRVRTFVCVRKASYTFMHLAKVDCLLRPNRIWRISYKCARSRVRVLIYHKYYRALLQNGKKQEEKKFSVENQREQWRKGRKYWRISWCKVTM